MLQRAASNAYSWWWASHIRTKQSKWMEQNLQDMDEKVQSVLKMMQDGGDSFGKRAEMYYKQRPELINFIEETYKAYKALADRYDKLSTELQNANNTIASVFPEQVQFSMDEEDEEAMHKFTKKESRFNKTNIPRVPKAPIDLKTVITITKATNKMKPKKRTKLAAAPSAVAKKSGLTKQEALSEIDKLQKQILSMQTEKEFLKSSYESQLARYWAIENQIKEMQARVFNLQDEYGEGMVIEDDEARNLMATAALKSCQESLARLQEKQERTVEKARIESTRIKEIIDRLFSLKGELHGYESKERSPVRTQPVRKKSVPDQLNQEIDSSIEEKQRVEQLRQEIKKKLEASTCLTMTEMAENIDEIVNKVISLETALSSQTALVNQLRSETNEFQTQIQTLEDDKASIIDGKKNLPKKLKDMEEKLDELQDLNRKVENEESNFQSQIIEVHCNLDHLSGKLPSIQQDEEPQPKSSISTVQLEQPDKLPGVMLGTSGPHTELKQPDEKLKDHDGNDNPRQVRLDEDETCQLTDSRRNEDPVIEMKKLKLQSPKEEESQDFEGKSEKADASGMNRNQDSIGPIPVDPPNLESIEGNPEKNDAYDSARNPVEVVQTTANSQHSEDGREEAGVNATFRSQVKEVQTQDKSQSSKGSYGSYEKPNAGSTAESQEEIILALSVDTEGNPEKNDAYDSARNPVEIVQTTANSQHSEGGREEAGVNATYRSQVEEIQTQDKSQSSKGSYGSYEKLDAGSTAESQEEIILALLVDTEGNLEKNGNNGSAGNPGVVKTEGNSQYSEGCVSGTPTNRVEEAHKQANLEHPSEQNKEEKTKTCSGAVGEEQEEKVVNIVYEPNLEQLFSSGIEDREKVLLTEYTTTLKNFKDAKRKLDEMDEKNRDHHLETSRQLNELKTANALKDQEIRSLHHKLNLLQKCLDENKESVDLSSASDHQKTSSTSEDQNVEPKITVDNSAQSKTLTRQVSEEDLGFDISKLLLQQPTTTSEIEERLRMKIDELLEENLDFWLKFSTSFHQTQKFETGIKDLKLEVTKLQEKGKKQDESSSGKYSLKSEARPLYRHLREIQTELNVWSDTSAALRAELENRFSSLCNIQKEITDGLKASAAEDDFSFTSYQAAKFQGEVLNMKQENNRVANELQAALDHIGSLQLEVETNLTKLNDEFRLSGSTKQDTPQLRHSESRNRVPLRSFIFGVKPKKQSIFAGMAPVMQKKYYAMKAGTL